MLCAHARARDSIVMCVKHGVDVIYHASYIDDEGMGFYFSSLCSTPDRDIKIKNTRKLVFCFNYSTDRCSGMDLLEKNKTKHVVAPAINWLIATLEDAEAFGYPNAKAEQAGYKTELDTAILGLREMHRRGIVVLPGG